MGKKKTTHTADLYDKRNTRINTERSKNEKLNMDIKDKGGHSLLPANLLIVIY